MLIGDQNTDESVYIIAEIGNNHEGDFALAQRLVKEAAAAGANAVKFQTIVPELLVSSKDEARIQQLRRFQFSPDQFGELASLAKSLEVDFLSTPFALEVVDWLNELVPAWKIASCDNGFIPLLEKVATTGKPVLISMGLGQHETASGLLDLFTKEWEKKGMSPGLGLLHCVVSYPTPDDECGLSLIEKLKVDGVTPGYSDHTIGTKAAELAVAAGARVIEKHFTIDKNHSDFRDHQLSADPADFAELVEAIRGVEVFLGNPEVLQQECESANEEPVRRSMTAACDLPAGSLLSKEQVIWVRPGGGIRPGEEAPFFGKPLTASLKSGDAILPDHFA